ncbi:toxin glutamine deamidase domain-containing protein [Cryptosporangium sp. NPDC048952]|uniref:toxin glutamine deamidase domain-containing protein n=1 Tax=Cryptosporangium sp. NPDC048952 TaxID=3363961 RepID=UPI003712B71C
MAVWKPDFGEYDYVWDFICGVTAGNPWPEGNEDDLWVLAQEWAAVAQALGDAMQDAGPVVNDLITAWGGDSGYAFLGLWEVLGQSSESGLGAVADMAGALSDMSDHAALELQYNKLTTLITVIITIISVFTALIGAFFTGGGSAAAIQPIMMGGRVAVQQSFRQLVRSIARKVVEKELRKELLKKAVTREGLRRLGKEALEELVEEVLEEVVLVDGLSQAIQMAGGHRTSWDGSKTAAAAIGATAGVPIGMGVAPAVRWAKNRAGRLVTDRLSDATINRINRGIDRANSPSTRLGGLGKQFAGTPGQAVSIGLVNAVTSPTSSWIANGTVYGNWDYPTDSIMSSALAGASRANTISPAQLAAAALTGGPTAFRETLLGSHPAALDLNVPTTYQPAPALPGFPDASQATASDAPSNTAQTPSAPSTSPAPSTAPSPVTAASPDPGVPFTPITAALTPDSVSPLASAPPTQDPTTPPLPAPRDSAMAQPSSIWAPDGTAPPASNAPAEFTPRIPDASPLATSVIPNSGAPMPSASTLAVDSRPAAPSPAGSRAINPGGPPPSRPVESGSPTWPSAAQTPTAAPATQTRSKIAAAGPIPANTSRPSAVAGAVAEAGSLGTAPPEVGSALMKDMAPTSPAGGERKEQYQRGEKPNPRPTSTGATARGTFSYRSDDQVLDPSDNWDDRTTAIARELAATVQNEIIDQGWGPSLRDERAPSIAGALVTSDGVVRSHTSYKPSQGTRPPSRHPDVQKVLDRIEKAADEASQRDAEKRAETGELPADQAAPQKAPWHGLCAEVALLSDFLFEFDATYQGPESGRRDAAMEALAGARIVSIQIWGDSSRGRGTGAVRPPCITCKAVLPEFGVTAISNSEVGKPSPDFRERALRFSDEESPDAPSAPGGGRPIGEAGGLDKPDPVDQRALEDSVPRDGSGRPVRYPHPLGRWLGLVNDGGPAATAFRANNCLDTALSLVGTWLGNPQVSAPRKAEYADDGSPSTAGETDGRQRAEETLGATFDYQGASADAAFPALTEQLLSAGHGASAVLITSVAPSHGGGSHAWNAVNHNGTIHWIDAQIGAASTRPLFEYAVDGVWSIVLDPSGQPVRGGDSPTVVRGMASIEEGKLGSGSPAAQSVALTSFAPDGRADHLPDLEPGELLAAAAQVRPEDFKSRLVDGIEVGEVVTVRLRDGRSMRFEAAVGADMQEVAATAVGRNRNVLTVNARVAPEQLARVWVHEIAAALQERAPRGLFRRALARVVGRRAGVDALVEARLSERRYLVRSLEESFSVEVRRELDELDRYLAEAGVRRLSPRPMSPLDPRGGVDSGALAAAISSRFSMASYDGLGVRVGGVDARADRIVVRLDVVDTAGRRVGVVRFSVNRDASGTLFARVERFQNAPMLMPDLERWFVESGVSRVEVRAAGVESYSWARSGFEWGSPAAADLVFARLESERDRVESQAVVVRGWLAGELVPQGDLEAVASDYPRVAPEAVLTDLERQLADADEILLRAGSSEFGSVGYPSPNEVALAGRSGAGGSWVGRRALVGVEWEGVRWLVAARGPGSPAGVKPSAAGSMSPRQMMSSGTPRPVGVRAGSLSDLGFADLDAVPEENRRSVQQSEPHIRMVDPTEIKFTQRSIGKRTRDGMDIDKLAERIVDWHGGPLHGVQWGDGSLASLDNRRLTAARRAGVDLIPFVAHRPDELLSDWPEDWPLERREFAAASVEIRELADGTWVVGGDDGKVVYGVGAVPSAFGEVALFRAAMGRDLLPGHLFGSSKLPVTVGHPRRSAKRVLPPDVLEALASETDAVKAAASAIETDLRHISSEVLGTSEAGGTESLRVRVQDIDALAADYSDEYRYFKTPAVFVSASSRVVDVSLRVPDELLYRDGVAAIADGLRTKGYETLRAVDTWQAGNVHRRLIIAWRAPHNGRLFELNISGKRSAGDVRTLSELDRILKEPKEAPERKVHAILRLLSHHKGAGDSYEALGLIDPPESLAPVWSVEDDSFARWVSKHPVPFDGYREWLTGQNLELADVVTEFGLNEYDFPIRAAAAEELNPDDAGLLHALREHLRQHGTGRDGGPGNDEFRRPSVGSQPEGVELRPRGGSPDPLQPTELRPVQVGESGGSGGDNSGNYRRGAVAGRGHDSVALPVEGGTAGSGSAVAPPADPAGGPPGYSSAGPFAREDPAPPLSSTRQYGEANLRPLENESYLDDVKDALVTPDGYAVGADPSRFLFGTLINDGGIGQPERDNNCLDCSLAALSSFYGRPEVAVPRWADGQWDGERDGLDRAMRWLGTDTWMRNDLPTIAEEFQALHDHVAELGPGSAALVVNGWQDEIDEEGRPVEGATHATVVVYPLDADGPVWWDPQEGLTAAGPPDWLVAGTVELAYITVEMDGRVNGGEQFGDAGGGTELPGSRRRARPEMEHAPVPARMGAAVGPGDAGADRARATAGEVDLDSRGEHRTDHSARALSAAGDHSAVSDGDHGGSGSRGSADLPEAAPAGSDSERGATGADAVGRVGGTLLLREGALGIDRHRHRAPERTGRPPVDPLGFRREGLEVQRRRVPLSGTVRSPVPADRPGGGGSTAAGEERHGVADGGRVVPAVPGEPGRVNPDGPAGPFAGEAYPLALTRGFGKQRLRRLENEAYQSAVDKVLNSAIGEDPRFHPYGALINDGGPARPGRDNNCLDCSLAAISSFYGRPAVSMARWPDGSKLGELRGIVRAMQWLNAGTWLHHDHLPTMAEQFWALHDHVAELGPGSAALVVNIWQDADENGLLFDDENQPLHGESHATVVVYPLGADGPVWWDPQQGTTSDGPPEDLAADTIELSYITVELDGRVNGDGTVGYEGSSTGVPGSRLPSRLEMEHVPVPARVGAAVGSVDGGGSRTVAATREDDVGARGEHGPNHIARALSATGHHQAVPGRDGGGSGSRGSADLSGAASAGSTAERGAPGAHAVGRVDGGALLPGSLPGLRAAGVGRDGADQRRERPPLRDADPPRLEVGDRLGELPGPGPVPVDSPGGPQGRGGATPAGPHRGAASARDDVPEFVRPVTGAAAAHGLTKPAEIAAVASAYDIATRWTAPYLVASVDRLLRRLNPQATGDVRFLFVTADDTVPWIVGRLAPDFARRHALWVQWPPTPAGWRHLRAQHPATLVTDDPATLPAARPLLSPSAPGSRLVGRLHGPVPDPSAVTAAQRMAARAAVADVVRMAMRAGPETGRTAVYAAANDLDRRTAEPDRLADPLLAAWL